MIALGSEGGAGNLIICEVLLMHIKDEILNEQGMPDPIKADLVGRMGADWYCRANGEALFELPKPNKNMGIGYDQIPSNIKNSVVLSGNNLGRLGNIEQLPDATAVSVFGTRPEIEEIKLRFKNDAESYGISFTHHGSRIFKTKRIGKCMAYAAAESLVFLIYNSKTN